MFIWLLILSRLFFTVHQFKIFARIFVVPLANVGLGTWIVFSRNESIQLHTISRKRLGTKKDKGIYESG